MKKRIIAFALCLVMLLGCLGMSGDVNSETAPVDPAQETDSTVESPVLNCVNFTNAAPLSSTRPAMFKARALAADADASRTDNDSVVTSKEFKVDNDGNTYLRLETYVTGSTQTVVTQKPTDIVLVLDTSGSMDEKLSLLEVRTTEAVEEIRKTLDEARYYLNYIGDGNHIKWGTCNVKWGMPQKWVRDNLLSGHWEYYGEEQWVYYAYSDIGKIGRHWETLANGVNDSGSNWNFTMSSKLDALKIAALKFIDSTAQKNGDNRIAIVTYANDVTKWNDGLVDVPADVDVLNSTIRGLQATGATRADLGMKEAQSIIGNIPESRDSNKVVIMFTDGVPTKNSSFETDVANDAIKYSGTMKNDGTTVYTIGVVNGADPTKNPVNLGDKDINKYLHYVSSNYLTATKTSDTNLPLNPLADPFGGGKSYYMSANNSSDLSDAFQNISSEIGGASIKLDSSTVVKDVISDYFKLPDGSTDETKIKVMTADCTAVDDNGKPIFWDVDKIDNSLKPIVDTATKTVSVSGYDFSEHWVGKNKTDNKIHEGAQKLIIEIPIVPETGFLGGNNVPTNADTSGVYDGEGTLVENYEVPTANVPINLPELTAKDAKVYYGGDVPNLSKLYEAYTIAPKMDDFVNITYALDKDVSNTEDGTYTITATAEPKYDGYGAEGTPATAKTATAIANVYVFKPEITYKDSAIDLGQTPNYEDTSKDNCNFVKVEWKHGNNVAESSNMIGNAPTLSYEYNPAADSAEAFKTDTYVSVTVKIGDKDITEAAVKFKHAKCDYNCSFNTSEGQFIVHIKTFDLTIIKAGWNSIDKDQSFVFNIVCEDKNINMKVVIVGNDSVTIKGLPVGAYTITEDAGWSWRYELNAVNAIDSTGECIEIDNGCTYTPSGTNNSIVFTNSRIQQQWLSFANYVKNVFQ